VSRWAPSLWSCSPSLAYCSPAAYCCCGYPGGCTATCGARTREQPTEPRRARPCRRRHPALSLHQIDRRLIEGDERVTARPMPSCGPAADGGGCRLQLLGRWRYRHHPGQGRLPGWRARPPSRRSPGRLVRSDVLRPVEDADLNRSSRGARHFSLSGARGACAQHRGPEAREQQPIGSPARAPPPQSRSEPQQTCPGSC
jgi:hypothetical protein